MLRTVTMPVSNLVWADRHGSIGYKMMGRVPKRKGDCPDLPKPGWTGDFEWDGWIPYDELPELVDPEEGFIVTANNRVVDDDYPHHITSDWLDGYRAARIEQLLRETEEHDLESFRRMQTDLYSIPGDEVVHRLARLRADRPARGARHRAAEELGPDAQSRDRRRHDLPGVPAAAGAGVHTGGDRRPRPRRSLPGPRRQRLHRARHLAVALALPPARALGGGRRGADRRLLGRARARRAARGARRPRGALRARPRAVAVGPGPRAAVPPRPGRCASRSPSGSSTARSTPAAAQETVAQIAYDPNDPYAGDLGAELADGRRPGGARSAPNGRRSPASRGTPGAATTTTCSRAGRRAPPRRWRARGRSRRSCSRRRLPDALPPRPDQAHRRGARGAARDASGS